MSFFNIKNDNNLESEVIHNVFMNTLKADILKNDIALDYPYKKINAGEPHTFCELVKMMETNCELPNYFLDKKELKYLADCIKNYDAKSWSTKYPTKSHAFWFGSYCIDEFRREDGTRFNNKNISIPTIINILKKNLIHGPTIVLQDVDKVETDYNPVPVVYARWDALHKITPEVLPIVTTAKAIFALGKTKACKFKIFTETKMVDGKKKNIIVFHSAPNLPKSESREYQEICRLGARFEATGNQEPKEHLTFICRNWFGLNITKELDTSDAGERVEMKLVKYFPEKGYTLHENFIIETVFKCKLGEIEHLIIGFYNDNRVTLRYFSISDLYSKNLSAIDEHLKKFKENWNKIFCHYKNYGNGNEVEINKSRGNNECEFKYKNITLAKPYNDFAFNSNGDGRKKIVSHRSFWITDCKQN